VSPVVFTVVVAVAGVDESMVTAGGLTMHVGGEVSEVGETWQLRLIVPEKPLFEVTVMSDFELPPALIAGGENNVVCRLNSDVPWPKDKTVRATNVASAHNPERTWRALHCNLDGNQPDFTMRRFGSIIFDS